MINQCLYVNVYLTLSIGLNISQLSIVFHLYCRFMFTCRCYKSKLTALAVPQALAVKSDKTIEQISIFGQAHAVNEIQVATIGISTRGR